ncbi:DUF91 domain-containing protein [Granulicella sp. 5B5]|uniref:DUF5655 domain-containing protein n=1 Tax=Granulicella sp. 5B5 TaxID=1617967 RepID=UPI0015F49B5E|nr:DUF5655 domain-containing protein [Granulicella sp. 5B5]QMV19618.1 DUF91 domain-containing protein [Granulicella sp. 5B5]
MPDLKLFTTDGDIAVELRSRSVAVERSLQSLIEKNLEVMLGVRFLDSEYSTGRVHGGRIDSLGLDEDNLPVIVEYKRRVDENVINQGLFYLDWLMDHQAEFQLLVTKKLGAQEAERIDWSGPRLICIASDFTRYDEHAVQQIARGIDLIRYRRYGDDMLLLELTNGTWSATEGTPTVQNPEFKADSSAHRLTPGQRGFFEAFSKSSPQLQALYGDVEQFIKSLGDDVQVKQLKHYKAFRRFRNFATMEIHSAGNEIVLGLKVNIDSVSLEDGFIRDVREIGHFGTGNVQIRIADQADFERAKESMIAAYNAE